MKRERYATEDKIRILIILAEYSDILSGNRSVPCIVVVNGERAKTLIYRPVNEI
jgi:hypothetical protein